MSRREANRGAEAKTGVAEDIGGAEIGRGYLWITAAKLWFLVTATLLNIGLPRLLGDPAQFGAFKVVSGFLAVISMVVLTGALQSSSKGVSESPGRAGTVRRRAERLALLVAGAAFALLLGGADLIADVLWQDPGLAMPLRIASVVVLAYGLYATWIGVANGLKRYRTQALFDIAFATCKTAGIIGAVVLGLGVVGIFGAFSAVAVAMTVAAALVIARRAQDRAPGPTSGEADRSMTTRRMAGFMGGVMGFNLTLNLLLQGDVVLLKGLLHTPSVDLLARSGGGMGLDLLHAFAPGAAALGPDEIAQAATSGLAGIYGAVRNVTMIPYQGIISLTFVIFPILSAATFHAERARTEATVRGALRFAVLLIAFLAGALALTDDVLIGLLFGADYRAGVIFLAPMVVATVTFALYVVLTSMLTAAGYPGRVLLVGAVSTALHLGLVAGAAGLGGTPYAQAEAMAWASTLGPLVGFGLSARILVGRLGLHLPWWSVLRGVGGAGLVSLGLGSWLPAGGLLPVVLRLAAFAVGIFVVWVATREIRGGDLQALRRLLGRRAAS